LYQQQSPIPRSFLEASLTCKQFGGRIATALDLFAVYALTTLEPLYNPQGRWSGHELVGDEKRTDANGGVSWISPGRPSHNNRTESIANVLHANGIKLSPTSYSRTRERSRLGPLSCTIEEHDYPSERSYLMVRRIMTALRQVQGDLAHLLDAPMILPLCRAVGYTWRQRVLDPVTTIHLSILQVLHGNTAL